MVVAHDAGDFSAAGLLPQHHEFGVAALVAAIFNVQNRWTPMCMAPYSFTGYTSRLPGTSVRVMSGVWATARPCLARSALVVGDGAGKNQNHQDVYDGAMYRRSDKKGKRRVRLSWANDAFQQHQMGIRYRS